MFSIIAMCLGIIGVCVSWIPGYGWIGVALSIAGIVLGVPAIGGAFDRLGSIGYGISGTVLGSAGLAWGLACQVKHAAPSLDGLLVPLAPPQAWIALCAAFAVAVAGALLMRTRVRILGFVLAFAAVAGLCVSGAWALTTADRAMRPGAAARD
ncbi:MAG: hypothetical protein PHU25_02220 [Deltaproteobacteria bacterium]|nr:hypothetical protein [Deltaproteobacteria bacterium]